MIKLTSEEIRHIGLFESLTGAQAKDCVIDEGRGLVTFVVKRSEMGLAIGREGSKVKRLEGMFGKDVEVVEFSEDPIAFIRNVLAPAKLEGVELIERGGKKIAIATTDFQNRKLAVGRKGRKLRNAKKLAFRHHGIEDIILK
jgi:N utilization substance protein A